jgi:phosphatidylserine/phosphatidylglycerophosphate/cardiolipin synthase-like enzyme
LRMTRKAPAHAGDHVRSTRETYCVIDVTDYGLTDSELDETVLFWHRGDHRRAVVTWDYGSARDYLTRLLELLNSAWVEQSVASQLTRLRETGTAIVAAVRGQRLGLMRPKLLGSREAIAVVGKQAWRSYVCERPTGAWEKMLFRAAGRKVTAHHTELERLILLVDRESREPKRTPRRKAA